MRQETSHEKPNIYPYMTILDVVSRFRNTEAVFSQYNEKAGACLCCQALFDPLKEVARKYGLDLRSLINELENVIEGTK